MDNMILCPGCMTKIVDNGAAFCPNCRYDLTKPSNKPHQLKPYTMLGETEKRYMVGRVVGEGAFGVTYVGYDTKLEIKVAIKEFYPRKYADRDTSVDNRVQLRQQQNFDIESLREDSINEAKNLAKLDKLDGVVEVKDYFRDNNTIYIVMEFIEGTTLKTYLANHGGKIPVERAKQMIKPVMESLLKVHKYGMIHRDISPDNIMVTSEGKMKLIDFGTAKEDQSNDKIAVGKKGYAPIEQYSRNGKQGPWTDVYALAATFYECVTGEKPDSSKDRAVNDTLKPPSKLNIKMSAVEEEALRVALLIKPEDRFQNMQALYHAFYEQKGQNQKPSGYVQPGQNPPGQTTQAYVQQTGPQQVYGQPPTGTPQGYVQQTGPQQVYGQTGPIAPMGQAYEPPKYEPPVQKQNNGSKAIVLAVVALAVIAVGVGGFLYVRNKNNGSDEGEKVAEALADDNIKVENVSSNIEISENASEIVIEKTANYELLEDIKSSISDGKYEDAISSLMDNESIFESDEKDIVSELAQSAVSGYIDLAISKASGYESDDNYPDAISQITGAQEYLEDKADNSSIIAEYADGSSLSDKYNSIFDDYLSYLNNSGLSYANKGDDYNVNSMFATADSYFSGDDYEETKQKVYTYLIIANANSYIAGGTELSTGISYVKNNIEKTGYNCWAIEFLDVMREQYRVQNNQPNMNATVSHQSNGYLIPDSNSRYLTRDDLSKYSQYELYLAYFEIYAREHRTFSDSVVNEYFSGLSWYSGQISPDSFKESSLNEYEKSNATLIYNYQLEMGYR